MESLILHSTPTALWQDLILQAEKENSLRLSEELESYLVFLLMRFSKNPEVLHSVLATDFLLSVNELRQGIKHGVKHGIKHESDQVLRDVGDKCLLFSGLFPGKARKSRVKISYYVKLGQSAYDSLSGIENSELASLFSQLSHYFVSLMDVLQTLRELNHDKIKNEIDLLQAEELWHDTHSLHALKILRKHTNGFLIPGSHSDSDQRH